MTWIADADVDMPLSHTAARPAVSSGFGVAATAQQLGVAPSTLRAWERRYGVMPSGRTSGGHRRYNVEDLAALQRMRTLIKSGVSTASAAGVYTTNGQHQLRGRRPATAGNGGTEASRFADAVQAMAPARASRVAARLLREHGAAVAWEQVFVPYLQALGEQWAHTAEAISEEHIAVAALQMTLRAHATRRARAAGSPQVLAAAVPGERHTLALDALAAALAELGIRTCVLYDVPASVLHAAVARHPGAAVVLWSHAGADLPLLRGLAGQTAGVCAAGTGWRRARLPASVSLLTTLPRALQTLKAITVSHDSRVLTAGLEATHSSSAIRST